MRHSLRPIFAGLLSATVATVGAAQPKPSVRIRKMVARMPVEQQVGQLVMPWLLGNYVGFDADGLALARMWVDSLKVGGIIISIGSPMDVAAKLNFLQRRSKLPLLIASDLESGAAFRFPGATPFPTNMGIGAGGRAADAELMGRVTGIEGRAVGVHLVFAPVADINNNPANPIINTRSFGGDPATVGQLVAAAIKGTRSTGVLTTAKHFPGHGDTETDSHISLPVIRSDWARLSAMELVPFKAAIAAGVDVVMSAHIALPAFSGDSVRPATLSGAVLTGMLRDSLHFRGLVVTDALDMGALVSAYGGGEAAVRAFEAGSDLLLMPANPQEAIIAMVAAIKSKRITRTRLRTSVLKVMAIKEKLGLFKRRTVSLDSVGVIVGQQKFLDSARAISARSLVLVRDSNSVFGTIRQGNADLALIGYGDDGSSSLARQLTRRAIKATPFRLVPASGPASYDSARAVLALAPTAVFSVAVRVSSGSGSISMPPALADLIEETSRTKPTVLISFGSPYLLSQTPTPQALLLAWTSNAATEEAVANAFAGAAITGRLPIDLPPTYRIGDGLILPTRNRTDATIRR